MMDTLFLPFQIEVHIFSSHCSVISANLYLVGNSALQALPEPMRWLPGLEIRGIKYYWIINISDSSLNKLTIPSRLRSP